MDHDVQWISFVEDSLGAYNAMKICNYNMHLELQNLRYDPNLGKTWDKMP